MPNFVVTVPGEGMPRSFRYDATTNMLYTDAERENPIDGMSYQTELEITEKKSQTDPQCLRYWEATSAYRQAYQLCDQEDISIEEALTRVDGIPDGALPQNNTMEFPMHDSPPVVEQPIPPQVESDPIAGIVITNQQLILKMLFELLYQYVSEEDKNYRLIELLQGEVDKIDEHEINI